MTVSPRPSVISRRAIVRFFASFPFLSALGLSTAAAEGFVEIDGWILKRSDLRRKGKQ